MNFDPFNVFIGILLTIFTIAAAGLFIEWDTIFNVLKRIYVKIRRPRNKNVPMINLINYLDIKFKSLDTRDQNSLLNRYDAFIDYLYGLKYRITYDQYVIICTDLYLVRSLVLREEVFNHVMGISSLLALPEHVENKSKEERRSWNIHKYNNPRYN